MLRLHAFGCQMRFFCLGLPLVFTLVSSCSSLNSQVNHHLYPFSQLLAPSFVRPLYLEHSSISLSVSVHCCQAVSPWGSALCCMEAFPGGELVNSENSWASPLQICVQQIQECTCIKRHVGNSAAGGPRPQRPEGGQWHVFCMF